MNGSKLFLLYGGPIELTKKLIRKLWHIFFLVAFRLGKPADLNYGIILLTNELTHDDRHELTVRQNFYLAESQPLAIIQRPSVGLSSIMTRTPIMVFGYRSKFVDWLAHNRPGTFDVDFRTNPLDGWEWINLMNYVSREKIDLNSARERLKERIILLRQEARPKSFIFGTGPSLERAMDHDWNDGYRIVCNTIVRDPILWKHIKPDFIVAGDAIYHFGHTQFAKAFRRDLHVRLEESNTLFLYPAQFHALIKREFAGLEDQLVPIPSGWRRVVTVDLTRSFRLPNLGNVLGLLLLPLACTLSKHIFLFGFDGRGPADKLFWSNSTQHTYPEYMDELKRAHPRFFEHYVPAADPTKYVRQYQGDQLELALQMAEKEGWTFEMMHPSWTPTLQKRYHGDIKYGF